MAGSRLLVGRHLTQSLLMLEKVTRVLEDSNVDYWLEGGTLLGVIREQRLLPWDTDIDISIRADQASSLETCLGKLRKAGERVRIRAHRQREQPFDVGAPRLIKVRNRKLNFFRGDVVLDLFVKYRHGDNYYWVIGDANAAVTKFAPARFYDRLSRIAFNGKHYFVPADYEEYLEFRYGDWRTPVKAWDSFSDDLAITANGWGGK